MSDLQQPHISPGTATPVVTSRRSRSRSLRWMFRAIVLVSGWGMIELLAWGLLSFVCTQDIREIAKSQDALQRMEFEIQALNDSASQTQTIHPFVGWVRNPEVLKTETYEGTTLRTNRFGFLDTSEGIFLRSPQRLIVAISGGSVAHQLSCAGADRLSEQLRSIPAYRDREVVFVRLAQSAYKQPQALFALNYSMLQGAEFDIVINLDGLNEVTMTLDQNYPQKVALDYPQGWKMRTAEIVSPLESDLASQLIVLRGTRRKLAVTACNSWMRRLPSQMLLWHWRDSRLQNQLLELREKAAEGNYEYGFVRCGPQPLAKSTDEALTESIRIWKQSSRQMHRLCQASGILYLHAIQPNQYDPGSKPLAPEELELMDPHSPGNRDQAFAEIIAKAYPRLREAGTELQSEGVRVVDLTGVFREITEPLYVDSCCHVKPQGSEIMAIALGAAIRAAVETQTATTLP